MKRVILYLSVIALAVTSCEDFLTKAPETTLSPGTYFSSKAELDLWANKFYADILPNAYNQAALSADDHGTTTATELQRGTRTPSTASWSSNTWKPLRNINYMLENNRCKDLTVKNTYDGVAYFFRAWFYYKMVRQYGDVPWYDHVIASGDTKDLRRPRDPRGYVMLKVIQDLDKAYELLPDKWESDPVYHVSKDAVLALKSRAALYEGTFRKYHSGLDSEGKPSPYVPEDIQTFEGVTISSEYFLRQAADAASKMLRTRKLYTGNTLELAKKATDASYREYFILEDAETDETILSRRYSTDASVRHNIQFGFKNAKRSASERLVNHYLQLNGKPIQKRSGWETLQFADVFKDRDPRMSQSIQGPGFVNVDIDKNTGKHTPGAISFDRTFNGYRIIKYISDSSHESTSTSTTDYPVFRYAEVLLNYAEAKAELGELTDSDVANTIDVIRARVGMPAMRTVPIEIDNLMRRYYPNAKGTQLAAILEIRRERTVELLCEGFRQWDMLRWGEGAMLTMKKTEGFRGIYVPGLGEYDLDKDGKIDICLYSETKPSTSAPETNIIQIGKEYTLSGGEGPNDGYITILASEDYEWNEGRDYLWPIPADQRSITQGALSQNPGWIDGLTF